MEEPEKDENNKENNHENKNNSYYRFLDSFRVTKPDLEYCAGELGVEIPSETNDITEEQAYQECAERLFSLSVEHFEKGDYLDAVSEWENSAHCHNMANSKPENGFDEFGMRIYSCAAKQKIREARILDQRAMLHDSGKALLGNAIKNVIEAERLMQKASFIRTSSGFSRFR